MSHTETLEKPIRLFYSYSHKDEALLLELKTHLAPLRRSGIISEWHDRNIDLGEEWKKAIDRHLASADVILLLVSPDFINSDYCWSVEVRTALERHKRGSARVIPVILRPCNWKITQFAELQAAPTDGRAVTLWDDRDVALADVAAKIASVVSQLRTTLQEPEHPSHTLLLRTILNILRRTRYVLPIAIAIIMFFALLIYVRLHRPGDTAPPIKPDSNSAITVPKQTRRDTSANTHKFAVSIVRSDGDTLRSCSLTDHNPGPIGSGWDEDAIGFSRSLDAAKDHNDNRLRRLPYINISRINVVSLTSSEKRAVESFDLYDRDKLIKADVGLLDGTFMRAVYLMPHYLTYECGNEKGRITRSNTAMLLFGEAQ